MKSILVFCGSSPGNEPVFLEIATALGEELARREIGLIYGGAKIGLMGAVADAVLKGGGQVTGVLPRFLSQKEIAHEGLTELVLTDTMHERKTRMAELCDGVIALPGGIGTLEELCEMFTWAQLGLHNKPIGLLNLNNFYEHLFALLRGMVSAGFMRENNLELLLEAGPGPDLLNLMLAHLPDRPEVHDLDKV